MTYSERARQLLASGRASEGDTVRLKAGGKEYSGILMPHHDFSHPDIIVIKLKSGYNIGVMVDDSSELKVEVKAQERSSKTKTPHKDSDLP
ncbi:MAG TPA: Glu-tRNA(Gln) amidotransferase GatDE subunit D, partial [Methanomassiliicoccales archaeon]|nr:Glu-tRNA(Gln) amidotransferase GatDE subunit D [Methanomassiliicoccales archaeon]